jgi:adenosylhomocysteine nucleosidase
MNRPLGLLAALPDELAALTAELDAPRTEHCGGRTFHVGHLTGRPVVLVLSGIGKVASAATAALLCERFGVHALLFTGVAGGLAAGVAVGDVVVGEHLLQHDLDVSPLFPRWVVPSSGRSHYTGDAALVQALQAGEREVLGRAHPELTAFGVTSPKLHGGLIVSGDRFVSTLAESNALRAALPEALAVDMESASVAQVAADFGVPFAALRSISDRADDLAHVDFPRFLREVAAPYARDIVCAALQRVSHRR